MRVRMFSAVEIISKITSGEITASEITRACLEAIKATDDEILAWQYVDQEGALARAEKLDAHQSAGRSLGKLHGVPIAIKDIIDMAGLPTTCGSPILAGRIAENSARIVDLLLAEGAVLIGKTVSTEFAFMNPSKTKNPHHLEYSPGGSSAGSAAAIAAGHVPIAIGSQTNGSVIRPASFCGVFGLKPSSGSIPRIGILETSDLLDQIGAFANNIEDLALVCDVLADYDSRDPQSFAMPRPNLSKAVAKINDGNQQTDPNFVYLSFSYCDELDSDTVYGLEQVQTLLGDRVEVIDTRQSTDRLLAAHKTIHEFQIYQNLYHYFDSNKKSLSDPILQVLDRASTITQAEFKEAVTVREEAIAFFEDLLLDFDAILTPSALGEAPLLSHGTTGNAVCCTIWSLCGLPAINLPILSGNTGLPIGVQLVGKYARDAELVETANWLVDFLQNENDV